MKKVTIFSVFALVLIFGSNLIGQNLTKESKPITTPSIFDTDFFRNDELLKTKTLHGMRVVSKAGEVSPNDASVVRTGAAVFDVFDANGGSRYYENLAKQPIIKVSNVKVEFVEEFGEYTAEQINSQFPLEWSGIEVVNAGKFPNCTTNTRNNRPRYSNHMFTIYVSAMNLEDSDTEKFIKEHQEKYPDGQAFLSDREGNFCINITKDMNRQESSFWIDGGYLYAIGDIKKGGKIVNNNAVLTIRKYKITYTITE